MSDEMKRELDGLRAEMHKGMGEMRREMRGFRGEMRQEAGRLRTELRKEMGELRGMFRRTIVHVARLTGDVAEIKHELATNVATKADISQLNERMDRFAGSSQDREHHEAKNLHRLDDHERRLSVLEHRRA